MIEIEKSCSNCRYGLLVSVNGDILCRINGVVSPNYCCSKHKFDYQVKLLRPKCIGCKNFITPDEAKECSMGLCRLFSARQYNGKLKNACSKFIAKSWTRSFYTICNKMRLKYFVVVATIIALNLVCLKNIISKPLINNWHMLKIIIK
mgnify:CR=1 FL=1